MSFNNGIHKFLNMIGIVPREGVSGARNERAGKRMDERGGDFADEGAEAASPDLNRDERDSTADRYRASSYSNSRRVSDDGDADNVVEFKSNHQRYSQSAFNEYRQKTVIRYLRDIGDCNDVIDDLLSECQVLLNIEDADEELRQRAIDVVYGAQYALRAKMRRVSRFTYIIAPKSVEVDQVDQTDRRRTGGYSSNVRSFRS